jgi:hypothetical protein
MKVKPTGECSYIFTLGTVFLCILNSLAWKPLNLEWKDAETELNVIAASL